MNIPTIVGGCVATFSAEDIILNDSVDMVCVGEGETALVELAKKMASGETVSDIPNIYTKKNSKAVEPGNLELIDIRSVPIPIFDDFAPERIYRAMSGKIYRMIPLEFSRGCWWGEKSQCIFCGVNRGSLHFRAKSPERALSEITTLTKKYGVKRVRTVDANLNPQYLKTLLPELSNQVNFHLEELFFETKTNLTREQIHQLQLAGTRTLQPGIESFDTEILTYMRKGTTLFQNVQFLKWTRDYGLKPTYNFLYGFPGENLDAYRRMIVLVPLLVHLRPPDVVSPILLQRFSPLFDQADRWKLQDVQAYHGHRFFYPFKQKDLDELAYTFDYHFKDQCQIPTYFEPLKKELEKWRSLWLQHEPPFLAFDRLAENKLLIYDTRPCRQNMQVELSGDGAYAYLTCDEGRGFGRITEEVKKRVGGEYGGDEKLRFLLDGLVEQRIMLR
ncbi:MAG: RiPP maturation radical SAM C-methyltransferase [Atribacterota bacterium]